MLLALLCHLFFLLLPLWLMLLSFHRLSSPLVYIDSCVMFNTFFRSTTRLLSSITNHEPVKANRQTISPFPDTAQPDHIIYDQEHFGTTSLCFCIVYSDFKMYMYSF
jgi:hypothetical protein